MKLELPIGEFFEKVIEWTNTTFEGFFDAISDGVKLLIDSFNGVLLFPPSWILILIFGALAWYLSGWGLAIFTLLGLVLIDGMGLWQETIETLSLTLVATLIALLIGLPVGIWASRKELVERFVRPVLDFMQTMPAFVYLIPAVLFFRLGVVPGVMATVIFAMPPAVRLTNLGIRQVPKEVVEASRAFGSTNRQLLFKVQLPIALPTILAGVNQTIMLALSMTVIAAMIGAGGLGEPVLKGVQQLKIGLGFESGIAVVILAMFLDRLTQTFSKRGKAARSS